MADRIAAHIDASPLAHALRRYFASPWYLVTIAALTLLGFSAELDLFTMLLTGLLGCIGLVVGGDLLPAVPPTLMVVFQMSRGHSPFDYPWAESDFASPYFKSGAPFWLIVGALLVVVLVFLFHCCIRGTLRAVFTKKTSLIFWSLPLATALCLNGIFADGYTIRNLLFGIATAVLWILVYLIYYHGLENKRETMRYVLWCCITALLVLLAELAWVYLSSWSEIFTPAGLHKGAIVFGWGIHNNLGGMIAMLIPLCFYMATQYRRGWLFWLLGVVSWFGILLTLSRSAILVGAVSLFISCLAVCIFGKHRKLYRILFSVLVSVLFLLLLFSLLFAPKAIGILWEEVMDEMNSHGRFDLWRDGITHFKNAPIFGVGFFGITLESWSGIGMPGFLHNTPIQLLAGCGILGLLAYIVLRGRTVWLFVKKPTIPRTFLGLALATLLGTSLLDNHMFNIYPAFYYALFLALAEQEAVRGQAQERIPAPMTPFLLRPVGKDYLWGGNRLNTLFDKRLPLSPLAETWECSVHPDGPSQVVSGVHAGRSLDEVLREHPAYLGEAFCGKLPVLIKLIDAQTDLSVQVHPDDAYARMHEGDNGKSEMWYVLDAAEGATLIYGFSHDMTEDAVRTAIANGTLDTHLNHIPVHAGDTFYIPAGTVHAIGGGILIAEIQESSNVTYRVYDYDRTDKDGRKRPLHVDRALRVMQLQASPPPRTTPLTVTHRGDTDCATLCDCPYFTTERLTISTEHIIAVGAAFTCLLAVSGEGRLTAGGKCLSFRAGDCIFCPADTGDCLVEGETTLLRVTCKPQTFDN